MKILKYFLPILAAWLLSSPAMAVWNIETVDVQTGGDVGWYCSVTIDSSNFPHIAYYDYGNTHLKYATYNGSVWNKTTVDTNGSCGEFPSIAMSPAGAPAISYKGSTGLNYAYKTGSGYTNWANDVVETTAGVDWNTCLQFGTDNSRHIAYVVSDQLRYAKYSSSWVITSGLPSCYHISMDLTTSNNPYIYYYSPYELHTIYYTGSSWQSNDPTAGLLSDTNRPGYDAWLSLDTSNQPHISFWDFGQWELDINGHDLPRDTRLRYFSYNGSTWNLQNVDQYSGVTRTVTGNTEEGIGRYNCIALDSSNRAHISYSDHIHWCLKYATNSSGAWVTQKIDPITAQYFVTSIALDNQGNPHIAYYDQVNKALKYASWIAGAYTISGTIADGASTPAAGVYVFLSSTAITANTVTDTSGYYEFRAVPAGANYTVLPQLAGYIFSPANASYPSLSTNQILQNYLIMQASGYFIRGYLVDPSGNGIAEAVVTISGSTSGTCTTNTQGYYVFTNLPTGGTYTVTPSKFGITFTPASTQYALLNQNQESQNYIGTLPGQATPTPVSGNIAISGNVKNLNNQNLSGVTVTLSGTQQIQVTTDQNGNYGMSGLVQGGTFTLTVSKLNWEFEPVQRSYSNLGASAVNQNFIGRASASAPGENEVKIVPSILRFKNSTAPQATIQFRTSNVGPTVIKIYSIDGVLVKVLLDENLVSGEHRVTWNGTNKSNEQTASGVYFVDVKTADYRKMKKICIIK